MGMNQKTLILALFLAFVVACQKASEQKTNGRDQGPARSERAQETRGSVEAERNLYLEKVKVAPNFENWTALGVASKKLGMFRDALREFGEAHKLQPDSSIALNNLCATHLDLEEWSEAKSNCSEALKKDPNLDLAKNNLLALDTAQAALRKKIDEFKESRKDKTMTEADQLDLGLLYFRLQDFGTARKTWEKVPSSSASYAIALNNLATVDLLEKKLTDADRRLFKAQKLDPQNSLIQANIKWLDEEKSKKNLAPKPKQK